MKNLKRIIKWFPIVLMITTFSVPAFAWCKPTRGDASRDTEVRDWHHGCHESGRFFEDGFKIFPGAEIGVGSGALSASLGVNIGYKSGWFFAGTALKGQVVNIDRVNYRFMPASLNIMGLSMSVIPETGNDQNDKKLTGQSIGFAYGGRIAFAQLKEKDPVTGTEEEYLMIQLGIGF